MRERTKERGVRNRIGCVTSTTVLVLCMQIKLVASNFLKLLHQNRTKFSAHDFLIKQRSCLQKLQNGSPQMKCVWPTKISKFLKISC